MRIKNWSLLCVIILVFISLFFRLHQIARSPSGTLIDEASFGYNAYSILETGKDEHGETMPLTFKAFGDQKLPAFAYILVPFVKIFGLNNFSIRFPSAIAGSLLCIAVFFLLKKMNFSQLQSFVGGLVVAVSPWPTILSRFGFESNFGALFFCIGLCLLFHYYKKPKFVFAVLAVFFLGLTWYSYIAYRLATTFILLLFLLIYAFHKKKKFVIGRKELIIVALFLIIVLPLIPQLLSKQGTARFNQVGLLADKGSVLQIDEDRTFCSQKYPKPICYLTANKPLVYSELIVGRFIKTFSPSFLFLYDEDTPEYLSTEMFGQFPLILMPFYFVGMAYLIIKLVERRISKEELFVLASIPLSALPALLAGDPQIVRLSPLLPFIVIVMMYGIKKTEDIVKAYNINKLLYAGMVVLLLISGFYFIFRYTGIQTEKHEVAYGNYIPKLMHHLTLKRDFQIYIQSITEGVGLYAYLNVVNPTLFQQKATWAKPNEIGFSHPTDFQNIHITDKSITYIYCQSKVNNKKTLFVTNEKYPGTMILPEKVITTANGVHSLALIYNVSTMNPIGINCDLELKNK